MNTIITAIIVKSLLGSSNVLSPPSLIHVPMKIKIIKREVKSQPSKPSFGICPFLNFLPIFFNFSSFSKIYLIVKQQCVLYQIT